MRGTIIFVLLIPALAAIGHDLYLFHQEHLSPGVFSIDLLMKEFKISALGFLWTTYGLESYKSVVQTTDPETWATIDKMLTFKAFYSALAFAGVFIAFFTILKFMGIGPFVTEENRKTVQEKEIDSLRAGAKSKKMKYKRK